MFVVQRNEPSGGGRVHGVSGSNLLLHDPLWLPDQDSTGAHLHRPFHPLRGRTQPGHHVHLDIQQCEHYLSQLSEFLKYKEIIFLRFVKQGLTHQKGFKTIYLRGIGPTDELIPDNLNQLTEHQLNGYFKNMFSLFLKDNGDLIDFFLNHQVGYYLATSVLGFFRIMPR